MSQKLRFIDLAVHGGCSKKLGGSELKDLLSDLVFSDEVNSTAFKGWLDYGHYHRGNEVIISNVDIILPMVIDPSDFGEIAVAHVLSDIYTAGAKPLFGLNILGISYSINGDTDDVKLMLKAAAKKLGSIDALLVGGHTIGQQQEFYYGLAIVGIVDENSLIQNSKAKIGDKLVLTKPLGTSIASKLWKEDHFRHNEFQDVLVGMKQLNDIASTEMVKLKANACTDITGFGFLCHTHNLLRASGVSATININDLPIYESVIDFDMESCRTMIFDKNKEFVSGYVNTQKVELTNLLETIIYDAQVSGGLLVSLPQESANSYTTELKAKGIDARIVGEIVDSKAGHITLLP
jgi:selenide, water dikinase